MKILKKILLIVWAMLTLGLVIYSQHLKIAYEHQRRANKKTIEILSELSTGLTEYYDNMNLLRNDSLKKVDIDSLFKSSIYLTKYDAKIKKYKRNSSN